MEIEVCPLDELPPGSMKLVAAGPLVIGVFNLPDGRLCALLGFSTLKLALHKARGTALPEEWAGMADDLTLA